MFVPAEHGNNTVNRKIVREQLRRYSSSPDASLSAPTSISLGAPSTSPNPLQPHRFNRVGKILLDMAFLSDIMNFSKDISHRR